jgi:hypothetical protein
MSAHPGSFQGGFTGRDGYFDPPRKRQPDWQRNRLEGPFTIELPAAYLDVARDRSLKPRRDYTGGGGER